MPPMVSLPLRRALAVLGGAAVSAVLAVRIAPYEPSLAIRTAATPMAGAASIHQVFVEVRGGETLDKVTVESGGEGVRVLDPRVFEPVPPERGMRVTVLVDPGAPAPHRVRVRQEGRVARTYDVDLGGGER